MSINSLSSIKQAHNIFHKNQQVFQLLNELGFSQTLHAFNLETQVIEQEKKKDIQDEIILSCVPNSKCNGVRTKLINNLYGRLGWEECNSQDPLFYLANMEHIPIVIEPPSSNQDQENTDVTMEQCENEHHIEADLENDLLDFGDDLFDDKEVVEEQAFKVIVKMNDSEKKKKGRKKQEKVKGKRGRKKKVVDTNINNNNNNNVDDNKNNLENPMASSSLSTGGELPTKKRKRREKKSKISASLSLFGSDDDSDNKTNVKETLPGSTNNSNNSNNDNAVDQNRDSVSNRDLKPDPCSEIPLSYPSTDRIKKMEYNLSVYPDLNKEGISCYTYTLLSSTCTGKQNLNTKLSYDGSVLSVSTSNNMGMVWNLQNNDEENSSTLSKRVSTFKQIGNCYAQDISWCNKWLLTSDCCQGGINLWDLRDTKINNNNNSDQMSLKKITNYYCFESKKSMIYDITLDHEFMIAAGYSCGMIRLGRLDLEKCFRTIQASSQSINIVKMHPNARCVVSAGSDGIVSMFDMTTSRSAVRTFSDFNCSASINAMCISPNGGEIATGTIDGQITLWDIRSSKRLLSMSCLDTKKKKVTSLGFDITGTWMIGGYDSGVTAWWDLMSATDFTMQPIKTLEILISSTIRSCQFLDSGLSINVVENK